MAIFTGNASRLAATTIVLTVFALSTYALRVYCRVSRRAWGAEDWVMTAALVPFAVLVAGCLGGSFNGIGARDATLALPENQKYQIEAMKFFLIFEVSYCAAIIPIKLSISWMLIRVADGRKIYIYIQYVVIAVFVIMNLFALIFILSNCTPVSATWDPEVLENGGHCLPSHMLADVYYACTAVNIATDWVTAFMPVPLLWRVQINRNTKISIIGLMGLGVFASISACIRLKYTVSLTSETDYLYHVANVVIWGFAENGMGMVVGNTATLRPLFNILLDRKNSDYRSTGKYFQHSSGASGSHHTRGAFSHSYELRGGKDLHHTTTVGLDKQRAGSLSDGGSQSEILDNIQRPGKADIVVSRQVDVTYHQEFGSGGQFKP